MASERMTLVEAVAFYAAPLETITFTDATKAHAVLLDHARASLATPPAAPLAGRALSDAECDTLAHAVIDALVPSGVIRRGAAFAVDPVRAALRRALDVSTNPPNVNTSGERVQTTGEREHVAPLPVRWEVRNKWNEGELFDSADQAYRSALYREERGHHDGPFVVIPLYEHPAALAGTTGAA